MHNAPKQSKCIHTGGTFTGFCNFLADHAKLSRIARETNPCNQIYSWWFPHRLGFDEPEADPGAEDDESEGCVDLQQEEARLALEQELQVHPRVVPVPGPGTEQSIITL